MVKPPLNDRESVLRNRISVAIADVADELRAGPDDVLRVLARLFFAYARQVELTDEQLLAFVSEQWEQHKARRESHGARRKR